MVQVSWKPLFLVALVSFCFVIAVGAAHPWDRTQVDTVVSLRDAQIARSASRRKTDTSIAIEWLRIQVNPLQREQYLQIDAEIWTSALTKYPGFIDKTVWLNPNNEAEVIIIIRWASREQWFSIPRAELETIQQRFDQAFPFKYRIQEVREYQAF